MRASRILHSDAVWKSMTHSSSLQTTVYTVCDCDPGAPRSVVKMDVNMARASTARTMPASAICPGIVGMPPHATAHARLGPDEKVDDHAGCEVGALHDEQQQVDADCGCPCQRSQPRQPQQPLPQGKAQQAEVGLREAHERGEKEGGGEGGGDRSLPEAPAGVPGADGGGDGGARLFKPKHVVKLW